MELRLVSDPLLRSRTSPSLSFLTLPTPPLWRLTTVSRQMQPLLPFSLRFTSSKFHTAARQRAESSSRTADIDFLEDLSRPKHHTDDIPRNQINRLLDSSFPTSSPAKRNPSKESSGDVIEEAFRNANARRDPVKNYQTIAQKMQFPSFVDGDRTFENIRTTAKRAKRTVRSRPAVGRTIEVVPEKGVDFGRALRNLGMSCALNQVKQNLARQRYHERPGMKRKRLKRERWRKMFKESFRATVMRVKEMRRKGW